MSALTAAGSPVAGEVLTALLVQFRETRRSPYDPYGSDACWNERVAPLIEAAATQTGEWTGAPIAARLHMTNRIEALCTACGLCAKAAEE